MKVKKAVITTDSEELYAKVKSEGVEFYKYSKWIKKELKKLVLASSIQNKKKIK